MASSTTSGGAASGTGTSTAAPASAGPASTPAASSTANPNNGPLTDDELRAYLLIQGVDQAAIDGDSFIKDRVEALVGCERDRELKRTLGKISDRRASSGHGHFVFDITVEGLRNAVISAAVASGVVAGSPPASNPGTPPAAAPSAPSSPPAPPASSTPSSPPAPATPGRFRRALSAIGGALRWFFVTLVWRNTWRALCWCGRLIRSVFFGFGRFFRRNYRGVLIGAAALLVVGLLVFGGIHIWSNGAEPPRTGFLGQPVPDDGSIKEAREKAKSKSGQKNGTEQPAKPTVAALGQTLEVSCYNWRKLASCRLPAGCSEGHNNSGRLTVTCKGTTYVDQLGAGAYEASKRVTVRLVRQ